MQIGFIGLLGLLFIGLKLAGIITWSWWLVLLPMYASMLIAATVYWVLLAYVFWFQNPKVK